MEGFIVKRRVFISVFRLLLLWHGLAVFMKSTQWSRKNFSSLHRIRHRLLCLYFLWKFTSPWSWDAGLPLFTSWFLEFWLYCPEGGSDKKADLLQTSLCGVCVWKLMWAVWGCDNIQSDRLDASGSSVLTPRLFHHYAARCLGLSEWSKYFQQHKVKGEIFKEYARLHMAQEQKFHLKSSHFGT